MHSRIYSPFCTSVVFIQHTHTKETWGKRGPEKKTMQHVYTNSTKRAAMFTSLDEQIQALLRQMQKDARTTAGKKRRCYQRLQRLLHHERNARIHRTPRGTFCVYKPSAPSGRVEQGRKQYYHGLHPTLRAAFYARGLGELDLAHKRTPPETVAPPRKRGRSASKEVVPLKKAKRTCELYGAPHGARVHYEMQVYTEERCRARQSEQILRRLKEVDPCTLRMLNVFAQKQWLPVRSEWAIFDETMKMATSIDLIVLDPVRHHLIALELKTGYEGAYYGPLDSDRRLDEPYEQHADCPYHRSALQLATAMVVCRRKYQITFDAGYIVQTCSKSRMTNVHPLPRWLDSTEKRDSLYQTLIEVLL